jgi:hypothetical protein
MEGVSLHSSDTSGAIRNGRLDVCALTVWSSSQRGREAIGISIDRPAHAR